MARRHVWALTLVLGAACRAGYAPTDESVTLAVVRSASSAFADSATAGRVLVRPVVGSVDPLLSEMAFEAAVERQFMSEFPELSPDLFPRGRWASQGSLRIDSLGGRGVELLGEDYDRQLSDSLGEAYQRLADEFGGGSVVLAFAQPAVIGDEALVYYLVDQLLPMGRATFYAYLRRLDGAWIVMWRISDYVE